MVKIKNVRIIGIGGDSYGIIIPKQYFKDGIIKVKKSYEVTLIESYPTVQEALAAKKLEKNQ